MRTNNWTSQLILFFKKLVTKQNEINAGEYPNILQKS
jgi:hypothetical protein